MGRVDFAVKAWNPARMPDWERERGVARFPGKHGELKSGR